MDEKERAAQEFSEKSVAFYTTFLSAWVENRMETDKQLVTLSSLAIGLLMFFYDKLHTTTELVLWLSAGALFILTIIVVLCIFRNNGKYIESLILDDNQPQKQSVEKSLQTMTACAFGMFIVGIILTFSLAIVKSGFVIMKTQGG